MEQGRDGSNKVASHGLIRDLDDLLRDLCVKWGFCNRLSAAALMHDHPVLTAGDFAIAVLEAEGMKPALEKAWRRRIAQLFADRYGNSVSESSFLARDGS